jgi:hypothetical protein
VQQSFTWLLEKSAGLARTELQQSGITNFVLQHFSNEVLGKLEGVLVIAGHKQLSSLG